MAIIPSEEINNIRNSANIVDIISSYINLEPRGKNFFGICPFHDDHTPSLSVSPDKQIYTCFVCGASGNVFTFVQHFENTDFPEAVKIVADKIGYNLKYDVKKNNPNKKYYDLLDLANKYFINNLNSNLGKEAREYLINKRKLSDSIIDEFKIGLSITDNSLSKLLINKGYSPKEIVSVSLASDSEKGLYDLFRGRITFPICDDKGNIVAFSARIYNEVSENKYINSKESFIFKKGNILFNYDKCKTEVSKSRSVIICEGQMDAIRIYSSGIKNVCATMGTALTKEHISLLKKLNSKVILVMDNDDAGEKATLANGEELIKNNIETLVVRLSGEKDPDSYILKYGVDSFKDAIKSAITFFDFKIGVLKKNRNLKKSDELADYINKVIEELNKSDDEVLRAVTINNIASTYDIDKSLLESKLSDIKPLKSVKVVQKPKKKTGRFQKAAEAILYIMMNNPKYIKRYQKELNYFPERKYKLIANDILAFTKINGTFNLADFITYINDFDYKDDILDIINKFDNLANLEIDFDSFLSIIREWITEKQIEELKEELKNETDINRKEEINDLIINLKRGSEE